MTGPTRQRDERERRQWTGRAETAEAAESAEETDDEEVDLDDLDEEDLVRTADGELMHEPTGLIVEEDNVDRGPEWRAFNHSERQSKSRVGAPVTETMHDKGLTTTIDWKDKDAYGRSISSEKRSQMHRLRKWQERIRTKDAGERNLQFALSETDRMASALGVPRSLEEISEVSRVERKEIGRTYRYVSQELGLEMKPVDPKKYVPRFSSELELSEEVKSKANEIIETTAEQGLLSGKSPTGFAAAAIYAASLLCNEKKTQREVADVAQVTEVTIRNRYQEQIEAMGIHG